MSNKVSMGMGHSGFLSLMVTRPDSGLFPPNHKNKLAPKRNMACSTSYSLPPPFFCFFGASSLLFGLVSHNHKKCEGIK